MTAALVHAGVVRAGDLGLVHWSYVAMLAVSLACTLVLVPVFGLTVLRQPARLALTVLAAGTPFLVWDLWATHEGHWSFDPDQTLPWRVAGVPLEEVAFFVVIPVVSVLTLEGVRAARRGVRPRAGRRATRGREEAR